MADGGAILQANLSVGISIASGMMLQTAAVVGDGVAGGAIISGGTLLIPGVAAGQPLHSASLIPGIAGGSFDYFIITMIPVCMIRGEELAGSDSSATGEYVNASSGAIRGEEITC